MGSIKSRVVNLCETAKISVSKLERDLDFGNGIIQKWDRSSPSTDKLLAVANYFGVSMDYLCGLEKENPDSIPVEALRLIKLYDASSPAIQRAVLAVLESAQSGPTIPDAEEGVQ